MRTLLALLLLASPLAARPTLDEALDLDPANPPLGVTFLPVPPVPASVDSHFETDYGYALAVRGDLAFVGAPVIDDWGATLPGTVHVYRRTGANWSEIQTLTPPDAQGWMRFGQSIDLSADGSILVVGSDDVQQDTPATAVASGAYIYQYDSVTGRYRFLQKLVPASVVPDQRTGRSVGISGDWIVFGAPETRELFGRPFGLNNGSAYLYKRDPATGRWTLRQTLLPDPANEEGKFGFTVAIDGSNLCVTAIDDNSSGRESGRLYFYRLGKTTGTWDYEADFADPNHPDRGKQWLGYSMALSGDRLLASWNFSEDDQGHTFFFERVNGTWVQQSTLTAFQGGASNAHQTQSPYSGREVAQAGNLALTSGLDVGPEGGLLGNSTWLGELFRYQDGAYVSSLILGDIVVKGQAPVGFASPIVARARAKALATDGTTILVAMQARKAGNSDPDLLVAALSAESAGILSKIRPLLFPADAAPAEKDNAAFAYQTRLYEDALGSFITRHDQINTFYGETNRDNASKAEALLRFGYLSADPTTASELEMLFLDLAYGRAAAQLIIAKNTLRDLNKDRLEVVANLFLDTEIATVQSALEQSANGLNEYLNLLHDPLGVPPVKGNPAGRVLFAKHVPARRLVSPIDTDADPDSDPDVLLTGYKDLVLLYDLLLQHTRSAADLAFLLTARDTPEDPSTVRALIGDTQRLVFEQRVLLEALFPALTAENRDALGLTVLSDSIDAALNDLNAFEQNLNGTINLLSYEPDFLMLIQNQGGLFDSFDSFKATLLEANSPLSIAKNNREAALAAIDSYGSKQDDLEAEFSFLASNGTSALIPRLTEIVGVPFGTPGYESPQNNVGSEIWQQVQSIKAARLRIRRNGAEISNLHEKIRIENQRRSTEAGINASLSANIIEWGNQQASMTEEIGRIEAAQAAANALTELFEIENITKLITGVGVVNAAVQAGGEVGKANLEASKERLAATQEAAVRDADDDILDNNSKALVKTLLLEMNTLLIDSQEAALLLRQEAGRLTGLLCEKADLERRLAEVDSQLAARSFADPVHRLRALNTTELAAISFRNARQWLFFAARALEYKWNTPLDLPANFSSDGRAWTLGDLFKLRNAHELDRFFTALCAWDTLVGNNRTFVTFNDWFSLREDYFGYELNDDLTGDPLFYDVINPTTGAIENVDAITAFRFELQRLAENCDDDPLEEICLRFDTVRQNDFDTVTGQFQDTFFSDANYLDRIDGLRLFIRGPHHNLDPNDSENTISAELSYFGSSVIRNESAGEVADPNRPDLVSGEFTSYPNRFYRFDTRLGRYRFEEGLTFTSAEALKVLPDRSRSTLENSPDPQSIDAFRERSVATTSWLLNLQLNPGVNPGARLVIDEIDDIELFINHKAVQR